MKLNKVVIPLSLIVLSNFSSFTWAASNDELQDQLNDLKDERGTCLRNTNWL